MGADDKTDDGDGDERRYLAVRANYVAQDRKNIQFAAKEIRRFMSKPDGVD